MSEDAKAGALTILIPVRNEGLNLRVMLKVLSAVIEIPHEVLDVHDEAADDNIPVVQSMGTGFPHVRTAAFVGKGPSCVLRARHAAPPPPSQPAAIAPIAGKCAQFHAPRAIRKSTRARRALPGMEGGSAVCKTRNLVAVRHASARACAASWPRFACLEPPPHPGIHKYGPAGPAPVAFEERDPVWR